VEFSNRPKVHTKPRTPGGFISRDVEDTDGHNMGRVAGIGRDDKGGVHAGASPLLDEVDFIAGECAMTVDDRCTGFLLQVAERYLFHQLA
jgi:hypothetical protein